jgi:hypothetical protein
MYSLILAPETSRGRVGKLDRFFCVQSSGLPTERRWLGQRGISAGKDNLLLTCPPYVLSIIKSGFVDWRSVDRLLS